MYVTYTTQFPPAGPDSQCGRRARIVRMTEGLLCSDIVRMIEGSSTGFCSNVLRSCRQMILKNVLVLK